MIMNENNEMQQRIYDLARDAQEGALRMTDEVAKYRVENEEKRRQLMIESARRLVKEVK